MPTPDSKPRLLDELRESRRDLVKTCGPAVLVALAGFLLAFYFVEPPPPGELVIAAGPADGNYYAAAKQYAQLFEENDVKLTIRETAGSVENYELLLNDDSVQLAIVQGGTSPQAPGIERLEALATLYLEPLWVFHRAGLSIEQLSDLRGKRVAVGQAGSGTKVLTETLLNANGVQDGRGKTTFVTHNVSRTIGMLEHGDIDAAFFVLAAESAIVRDLLCNEQFELLSFYRNQAYAQRYPFLKSVVLSRGVIDLTRDLPRRDVQLIAPVANLVATRELHDAFIPLLLEAAISTHEAGGLVSDPGKQPSLNGSEFTPNAVARHYLKYGPSFFQKYLGFWIASLIDRAKIMLVPLVVLLIPLVKLAPPVYRWRIRSRIYRWYALLRGIDQALRTARVDELQEFAKKLSAVEWELVEVSVPLSYMEEFYHLRLHIDLVRRRLEQLQAEPEDRRPALPPHGGK